MLAAALVFAVVFPIEMPWLIGKIQRDLRRQVSLACDGPLPSLSPRFQSSAHELMSHLRSLLLKRSKQHRDALRWLLATLEIGHAVIDLRHELEAFGAAKPHQAQRWITSIDRVRRRLPQLFERPDAAHLARASGAVDAALRSVQRVQPAWYGIPEERRRMQRIVSQLHFIRSALLDRDAPFRRHPGVAPIVERNGKMLPRRGD